jgi:hypothetical protein
MGMLFCGFFHWSAPVMIWRYGFRRSVLLFAVPFLCALGAAQMWGLQDFFIDSAMHVLARVAIAMFLAVNEFPLVAAHLRRTGWSHAGTCGAEAR